MNWDPAVTERTALHEAGHAVVAWSFGLTVGSIHLDLATQGGHANIAAYTHLNPVEQIAIRPQDMRQSRHSNRRGAKRRR